MLTFTFTMHEGMGGPHYFSVTVFSNDAVQPEKTVDMKANFVPN